MRGFVLYVLLRLSGIVLPTTGFVHLIGWVGEASRWLAPLDFVAPLVPAGLVVRELRTWRPSASGRLVYLVSLTGLYGTLLALVRQYQGGTEWLATPILALALATAISHSVEYLALVTWVTSKKKNARGWFAVVQPHWLVAMMAFIVAVGLFARWLDSTLAELWVVINLAVSYLHYAYDGIIWKAPRPAR